MTSYLKKEMLQAIKTELQKKGTKHFKILTCLHPNALMLTAAFISLLQKENCLFSVQYASALDERTLRTLSLDSAECITLIGFQNAEISLSKKTIVLGKECGILPQTLSTTASAFLQELFQECNYALPQQTLLFQAEKETSSEQESVISSFQFCKTIPLHKSLEWSTKEFIPGISGTAERALHFLQKQGIVLRKPDGTMKTYLDMTEQERVQLHHALGAGEKKTTLILRKEEGPFQDADLYLEFLHAAIFFEKPSLAIAKLLGNPQHKMNALQLLKEYHSIINESLQWIIEHKNTEKIIEKEQRIIVQGESFIASKDADLILAKCVSSRIFPKGTLFLLVTHTLDNRVKINIVSKIELKATMFKLQKYLPHAISWESAYFGSHATYLPIEKEQEIKESLLKWLETHQVEEMIQ